MFVDLYLTLQYCWMNVWHCRMAVDSVVWWRKYSVVRRQPARQAVSDPVMPASFSRVSYWINVGHDTSGTNYTSSVCFQVHARELLCAYSSICEWEGYFLKLLSFELLSSHTVSRDVCMYVCIGGPAYIFTVFTKFEFCFHIRYKLYIGVYRDCVNAESCVHACMCVCVCFSN
jgi:hypothetical protein